MPTFRRPVLTLATAALCLALAILAGCSKKESAQPASSATQPAAQPATAAPAAQPASAAPAPAAVPAAAPAGAPSAAAIASAQFASDPDLRCDLLEVKRVSGGAVVVRWRLVNTAGSGQAGLVAGQPKGILYNFGSWNDLYYIDPAENKKYNFLTDAAGERILDVWEGTLNAGQQHANWAKFPAPPATSKKISISIPKFPPFEDVAVAE